MHFPRVPGHEIAGILTREIPASNLTSGERVVLWPALTCGTCFYCKTARENLCRDIQLFGYHLDGGFANEITIPEDQFPKITCLRIPETVSFQQAAFAEPLACLIHAFSKISEIPETCLILGAGTMGRLAGRLASHLWPGSHISLFDTDKRRVQNAKADNGVNQLVPADCILIAASSGEAFYDAIKYLRPGGTLVLFSGLPKDDKVVHLDQNLLHQQEQILVGSYGCRPSDMEEALEFLATGKVTINDLITNVITLAEAAEELGRKQTADDYKIIIEM
jgi:L-iditol 2-dehydrogenase